MLEATQLGAALYVPTTHQDLRAITTGFKLTEPRTLILCTEDSVSARDLPAALDNLHDALQTFRPSGLRHVFVRVRNPEVMRQVIRMPGAEKLSGFVLPKTTAANIDDYLGLMGDHPGQVMPTLETVEVFSDQAMTEFLRRIDRPAASARILCLRVGGNDLLALLRLRRPRGHTLYETPLGQVIARLVTTFLPYGFALSAPVFEHLDDVQTLAREIEIDLNYGLTGKTAIHPSQVTLIEQHYRARPMDVEAARRILDQEAAGVFQFNNSMCEPATHRPWATAVLQAERHFGLAS